MTSNGRKYRIFQANYEKQSDPTPRTSNAQLSRAQIKPTSPITALQDNRERKNIFRASRVYRRPNSADLKAGNPYSYNVGNHISVEGKFLNCNFLNCKIIETQESSKVEGTDNQKTSGVNPSTPTNKEGSGDHRFSKKQNPSVVENLKDHKKKDAPAPQYHASYVPNVEPPPPRKTIFLPKRSKGEGKPLVRESKRWRSVSANKYSKRMDNWGSMETIQQESEMSKTSKMNSETSSISPNFDRLKESPQK